MRNLFETISERMHTKSSKGPKLGTDSAIKAIAMTSEVLTAILCQPKSEKNQIIATFSLKITLWSSNKFLDFLAERIAHDRESEDAVHCDQNVDGLLDAFCLNQQILCSFLDSKYFLGFNKKNTSNFGSLVIYKIQSFHHFYLNRRNDRVHQRITIDDVADDADWDVHASHYWNRSF